MHIAVIAANGRLGREFVQAALLAGHSVRAGIRGDNTLTAHANLEVVQCDATKPEDLRLVFQGQEVVVSAIGHVKNSTPDVQTVATRAIVAIMEEMKISRFVDVTGTGVRFEGDKISIVDRILNLAVGIIDKNRVEDGRTHQEVLKASPINWTTIRILKLQNVDARPYKLSLNGPTKWYVCRKEVATAMLEVVEANSFITQAPIISKP